MTNPSAERFWDREVVTPVHSSWMEHPLIRDYVLQSIAAGEKRLWPLDWFETFLGGRRFRRALSIGCGTGPLERDLIHRNLADRVDAFDGSTNSLRIAREEAKKAGYGDRIHYFASNFNEPVLPRNTYDLVLIHQALHHVAKLEKLLRAVRRSMTRDAVFYLDEYVGPSRHEWTAERLAPHRALFDSLPGELRAYPKLNDPVMDDDPSEAIRSSEIVTQLRVGFEIAAERGYGGNLLSVIYGSLRVPTVSDERMKTLIEEERRRLAAGEPSYYSILVATPKRGLAGMLASARYFTEPKLKRIERELKHLFS